MLKRQPRKGQSHGKKIDPVHPELELRRDPEPVKVLFFKRGSRLLVKMMDLGNAEVPPFLRATGHPFDLRDHFFLERCPGPCRKPNLFQLQRQLQAALDACENVPEAPLEIGPTGFNGISGATIQTVLQPEKTADHRVPAFDIDGILVPHKIGNDPPIVLGAKIAVQDRLHVLHAVKSLPRLLVGREPFPRLHSRMTVSLMEGVVIVKVRVHQHPPLERVFVIHRSRKRGHHKKRRLPRAKRHQLLNVLPDRLLRIQRETDDIGQMANDAYFMERINEFFEIFDIILVLLCGLEIFLVQTFHADKDLPATGPSRFFHEVRHRMRLGIQLHHEMERDPFFFLEIGQPVQDHFPVLMAAKIVIGEKIVGDLVTAVTFPDRFDQKLDIAKPHFPPLHINDRAKTAPKGTSATAIERSEMLKRIPGLVLGIDLRERRVRNIRNILQKIINGLEPIMHRVGQHDLPVTALGFACRKTHSGIAKLYKLRRQVG